MESCPAYTAAGSGRATTLQRARDDRADRQRLARNRAEAGQDPGRHRPSSMPRPVATWALPALGTPARSANVAGQGARPSRRTTHQSLLSLIRSAGAGPWASKQRGAALRHNRAGTPPGPGPLPIPAPKPRWWRAWGARTQFAAGRFPPTAPQPAEWDRARVGHPVRHHTRGRSAFMAVPGLRGGLGGAGSQSWSSSRANSVGVAAESEARAGTAGSRCRPPARNRHRSDERQLPPVLRAESAASIQGIEAARTARIAAVGRPRSFPTQARQFLAGRAPLTEAFAAGRQYQGLNKRSPSDRAREDGNGPAATTQGVCGCGCVAGLGRRRAPCLQGTSLQSGPWAEGSMLPAHFQGSA